MCIICCYFWLLNIVLWEFIHFQWIYFCSVELFWWDFINLAFFELNDALVNYWTLHFWRIYWFHQFSFCSVEPFWFQQYKHWLSKHSKLSDTSETTQQTWETHCQILNLSIDGGQLQEFNNTSTTNDPHTNNGILRWAI